MRLEYDLTYVRKTAKYSTPGLSKLTVNRMMYPMQDTADLFSSASPTLLPKPLDLPEHQGKGTLAIAIRVPGGGKGRNEAAYVG